MTDALEFTETYKRYQNDSVAIREAMCLKKQYPALLADIRDQDLLAGRRSPDRIVYTGSIWWDECTMSKLLKSYDSHLKRYLDSGNYISSNSFGFALAVDLDRLVKRGLKGRG